MRLPIHPELRASWWLREGVVGGTARPGFGGFCWDELSIEEAPLVTWLGSTSEAALPLAGLPAFLDAYVDLRAALLGDEAAGYRDSLEPLREPAELRRRLEALSEERGVSGALQGEHVLVEAEGVRREAACLRAAGIEVLVSLMERAPDADVAGAGLEVHHFAIPDMLAPERAQVESLAELLERCESRGRPVVVHCLAGIGRTTTMLAGAGLLRGEKLPELSAAIADANPAFRRVGRQWVFLRELAAGSPGMSRPRAYLLVIALSLGAVLVALGLLWLEPPRWGHVVIRTAFVLGAGAVWWTVAARSKGGR